ncbi:hypothetical protein BSKO_00858 [Bryopsis sp. KO-2023]|nr:hypothetical protein BSKO_00858 [Bryopsis sp. KO-2023]
MLSAAQGTVQSHSRPVRPGVQRLRPAGLQSASARLSRGGSIVSNVATPGPSSTESGSQGCPFHDTLSVQQEVREDLAERTNEVDVVKTPGPKPLGLRSAWDVSKILRFGIQEAMLQFFATYGPVVRFANPAKLNGAAGWLFVNDPDDIQYVCTANVKNYTMRYLPDIYKYVTHEKGILGSQGAYNKKHRQLCQPPFRSAKWLKQFAGVIVRRSERVAGIFARNGTFETDIANQMQRLSLDIIGDVAFSHDFGETQRIEIDLQGGANDLNQETDRLLIAVNDFGEILAEVFITPIKVLKVLNKLGYPKLRKLDGAVATMRDIMLNVINERRNDLRLGKTKDDLLGVLLEARDEEGKPMTDLELWEDVHDIMGAGHETTATSTATALYLISAHPEAEAKLVEELKRVLGGRSPTYEDLDDLQYTTQCVKESLRMYPPIPLFPREAADVDVLPSGHRVKQGDVVFMSGYCLGRSPAIWDEPMEFRPERFDPEKEEVMHRFQWAPFGAGPRMCLGANFAQMSVVLMVATLLNRQKFTPIQPTSKQLDVDYDITMNFNKTKGLKMRAAPRP